MKKVSFTKGQWVAVGAWVEHVDDSVPDICNCDPASMNQEGRSDEEVCANARLLAAAPTMLNALYFAKLAIEMDVEMARLTGGMQHLVDAYQKTLNSINDAITLATGEQA